MASESIPATDTLAVPPNALGMPLRRVWRYVGLALLTLIVFNALLYVFLFIVPYANLSGLALPYAENFDGRSDSDVIPLRGIWEVLDGFLIQHNPTGADLGAIIPLNIATDQPYSFQADMTRIDGGMGGGLLFNMQTRHRQQRAHVARFTVTEGGDVAVLYGFFGADGIFVGQGESDPLPFGPEDTARHLLTVQVAEGRYGVLVDGAPVVNDVPLVFSGGRIGLITAQSKVVFDNLLAEPLTAAAPPVEPAPAEEPPPAEQAADAPAPTFDAPLLAETFNGEGGASNWRAISGEWVFEPGALVQTTPEGYDYAIAHTQPFTDYALRVTFAHRAGLGGGVLFHMPRLDNRAGAHMVRYIDDVLLWGYFNTTGDFNGQGSAPVPTPGTESHVLEIIPGESTYTIVLDGNTVADAVPLFTPDPAPAARHIGLTSSQSVVAFTRVDVLGAADAAGGSTLGDLSTINGDWVTEGRITTQYLDAPTDFVAGTGVIAETYRVSVTITLPDAPELADAGGGLIIHMAGRDDPTLGELVRFADGGSGIMWGEYNDQRVFMGQGNAPLALDPGTPHVLTLNVRPGSFDILVDDTVIATDIPLAQESGWIGLVSFRGPVAFSDFQLTFGG